MVRIAKPNTIKQTNRKALLNMIRASGEVSVANISERLNWLNNLIHIVSMFEILRYIEVIYVANT
jgi:hypothetical protein